MAKRRSLTDRPTTKADPAQGTAFVYGEPNRSPLPPSAGPEKPHESPAPSPNPTPQTKPVEPSPKRLRGKWPISTTVRDDIGDALKRASLMRQLEGVTPNTIQGILEDALEPWLKAKGYLK